MGHLVALLEAYNDPPALWTRKDSTSNQTNVFMTRVGRTGDFSPPSTKRTRRPNACLAPISQDEKV
jgi:hypothetical protein